MAPMDFFFWGVVKKKMHEKNPKTVNEIKDYIYDAFREIDENRNLCRTMCGVLWTGVKNVAMLAEDILSP